MADLSRPHRLRAAVPLVLIAVAAGATCGDDPATSPAPIRDDRGVSDVVVRDGFEYRADLHVMESFPVQLAGQLTVANPSQESRTVTFPDGCVSLLRAYRVGGGPPVWDQASELGCTMALVPVELGPGESRTLPTPTASAREILGDDLPDGTYRIVVYARPLGTEVVEVDAGTVDLAIPR